MRISPVNYSSLSVSQNSVQKNKINSNPISAGNTNKMLPTKSQVQFTGLRNYIIRIIQENAVEVARLKREKLANEMFEIFSKATTKHKNVMHSDGKTVANSINYLETVFGKRNVSEIKFDTNGNFMRHTKYEYVPNTVNNEILKTIDYDSSGKFMHETCYKYKDGQVAETVDRDLNGNILKSTRYEYSGDRLYKTLDRDAQSNLVKEVGYQDGVNAPILYEKVFKNFLTDGLFYEKKCFSYSGKLAYIEQEVFEGIKTYSPDYKLIRYETNYRGGNKTYNYHNDGKTISSITDKEGDKILENNPEGKAIFTREKQYRYGGTVDMHVGTQEVRYSADGSKIIGKRYIVPSQYSPDTAIDTCYANDGKTVSELRYLVGTKSDYKPYGGEKSYKTLFKMEYDPKTGEFLDAVRYDKQAEGSPLIDLEMDWQTLNPDFSSSFLKSLKSVNKEVDVYENSFPYLLTHPYSYRNKDFIRNFADD